MFSHFPAPNHLPGASIGQPSPKTLNGLERCTIARKILCFTPRAQFGHTCAWSVKLFPGLKNSVPCRNLNVRFYSPRCCCTTSQNQHAHDMKMAGLHPEDIRNVAPSPPDAFFGSSE